MRSVSDKIVEKTKTNLLCPVTFSFEIRALCEIILKNIVERGRSQMTKGACALHTGHLKLQTHTEYVILNAFPLQQCLHERPSMLRYTYMACVVTHLS
jgi:hypothetical protein